MKKLWVEKYRPTSIDEYVLRDTALKEDIDEWIKDESIPHLIFYGPAGTGKTTLARVLLKEIGVQDEDIMFANGSKEGRRVEWIDKVIMFCSTRPFGRFKVVFVDEADFMNPQSTQPALRALMEDYSDFVRFVFTCNYPHRILPALHSRFQTIRIEKTDEVEFTARAATILVKENIEFDLDTLDLYVADVYPDLRKCINNLQQNSLTGKLRKPSDSGNSSDYRLKMVELFKKGKVREARVLICSQALPEEMGEIFTWLYNHLELFGDQVNQDKALQIIKQGLVDHALVIDPEINLSATLVRLANLNEL